jgi:hypothetical protein
LAGLGVMVNALPLGPGQVRALIERQTTRPQMRIEDHG